MPRFDPKDYVEVKDRIVLFWEKYPDGAIVTELLHVDDRCVRMKAAVYDKRADSVTYPHPPLPLGTGHAEEYRITEADIAKDRKKQYEPNATSAVENCETSAVGRALAMAGFEVSKSVASRQEMEKVKRQQAKRENEQDALDNHRESAKVVTTEAPEKLDADEALKLAGKIKEIIPQSEMGAVKLKLVSMGVEEQKTLSGTLQTMSREQGQELYSWAATESTSNAGQTVTA